MNKYILQHEGTLVELWYLDSFAKFFALEGETRVNAIGTVHKYLRSITLNHFGVESLKESLLPKIEDMLHTNLAKWASQGPVDVKQVISVVSALFIFSAWYTGIDEHFLTCLLNPNLPFLGVDGFQFYCKQNIWLWCGELKREAQWELHKDLEQFHLLAFEYSWNFVPQVHAGKQRSPWTLRFAQIW